MIMPSFSNNYNFRKESIDNNEATNEILPNMMPSSDINV